MLRPLLRLAGILVTVATSSGCDIYFGGGGDDELPDPGDPDGGVEIVDGGQAMPMPAAVTQAHVRTESGWQALGDADWSCWRTPAGEPPPGAPVELSGRLVDWQTGAPVGNAQILVHPLTNYSQTLGTTITSTAAVDEGRFAMTVQPLPPEARRYVIEAAAGAYVDTFVADQYLEPGATVERDLPVVASSTMTSLPAFVGRIRDTGRSIVLGNVVDCQGHAVSNAVVVPNGLPDQRLPLLGNPEVFYFAGGTSTLPVQPDVASTTTADGRFMILGVDRTIAYVFVQVWGFRDAAELAAGTPTMLSMVQMEAFVIDAANVATYVPRRL